MELQLLALAFEAALYPTLLAAVVILLNQPRRLPLLAAYLAGGLTISIGLGCLIVFGLQGSVKSSSSTLSWSADLAIGGLALIAAVAIATRADERMRERRAGKRPPKVEDDDKEPFSERLLAKGSVPVVFAAALAINLPGAAYLIGLKDIAASQSSTGVDILQILLFNVIMFSLAEIPLAGLLIAPDATVERVHRTNAWFSANGRRIAVVLFALLGVFLVVRGIVNS
jgi:hypothetical protein